MKVMCIIFAVKKGRQGPLRWSAFTKVSLRRAKVDDMLTVFKALRKLGFKQVADGQNGTGKGSARTFIPPTDLTNEAARYLHWDEVTLRDIR